MIGIYKVTSPTRKVYIGQSIDVERRLQEYVNINKSKNQIRLHISLVKYGFSEHIFEVVEECSVEELNTRERHWQDFYDVLGEKGMNCILTSSDSKSGAHSAITRSKQSASLKAFWITPKGQVKKAKLVLATDWKKKVENTDYVAQAKKRWKAVIQLERDGTFIQEWPSLKEVEKVLGISRNSISACCSYKLKSAGGFNWKYKNK